VQAEGEQETAFGRPDAPQKPLASVRVTGGSPESLADDLIASLLPEEVLSRQWQDLAGQDGLRLILQLPDGRFTWWFLPRNGQAYVLHAVTDSGLGSLDQMVETFTFVDRP